MSDTSHTDQLPAPGTRLERISTRRKPETLNELSPRWARLARMMVYGAEAEPLARALADDRMRRELSREEAAVDPESGERIVILRPVRAGEPLSIRQACVLCHARLKQGRDLAQQPLFKREVDRLVRELRDSAKPEAVAVQIAIMRDPARTAAEKKVRLEATDRILGEGAARSGGPAVNVNVSTIVPGYVIRLPPKREPPVIEGSAIEAKPLQAPAHEVREPQDFAAQMRHTLAAEGRRSADYERPSDQPFIEPPTTARDHAEAMRVEQRGQAIREGRGVGAERSQ